MLDFVLGQTAKFCWNLKRTPDAMVVIIFLTSLFESANLFSAAELVLFFIDTESCWLITKPRPLRVASSDKKEWSSTSPLACSARKMRSIVARVVLSFLLSQISSNRHEVERCPSLFDISLRHRILLFSSQLRSACAWRDPWFAEIGSRSHGVRAAKTGEQLYGWCGRAKV